MINDVTKAFMLEKYYVSKNDYIENEIDNKNYVAISKMPTDINGVKFRVSLFFSNNELVRVMLVAIDMQDNEKYIGKPTKEIHNNWLIENFGKSYKEKIYGISYKFDDIKISSEHDPRSLSDHIIIDY